MLDPFIHEGLVIKSKEVTLKRRTMYRQVGGVNCLLHQAVGLQLCFSKRPHFSNQLPFLLREPSPVDTSWAHTQYTRACHMVSGAPRKDEIFITQCQWKRGDVTDSTFGVLFLLWLSDTAAQWGREGRGLQMDLLQRLSLNTYPVTCEIRVLLIVYYAPARFLFTNQRIRVVLS